MPWKDLVNLGTGGGNTGDLNGYTIRVVVPVSAYGAGVPATGTKIRVTISSAAGATANKVYVGHAATSGDAYDFDGTQVQLSAFASTTWNISTFRIGDVADYAFDKAKPLVVAFHCSGASDLRQASGTGWTSYIKASVDEAATTDVAGYTPASANSSIGVARVEVFTPEANWFTLHNITLNSSIGTASTETLSQVVPVAAYDGSVPATGSKLRITVQGGNTSGVTWDKMYVGHAASSGDAWDFDGTQVQVTFGGNVTGSVGFPQALVTSDEVTYAFNKTKPLVIRVHASISGGFGSTGSGVTGYTGAATSGDVAATTDVGGTVSANTIYFTSLTEVYYVGGGGGGSTFTVQDFSTVDNRTNALICVEVVDPPVIQGYTEVLSSPDSGTGTYPITGAVNNGHGHIRLTTTFAANVGATYIQAMGAGAGGKILCTVWSTAGYTTGQLCGIRGARGCIEANCTDEWSNWKLTVVDGTHILLENRFSKFPEQVDSGIPSAFVNAYTGGAAFFGQSAAYLGELNRIVVHSTVGTTEANRHWAASRSGSGTIDLQSSVFTNTYTSGGVLIDPNTFVQRTHPILGTPQWCLLVGRDGKTRRYSDIRSTTYLDREAAKVAANYGITGGLTVTGMYLKTKPYSGGGGMFVGTNFQQPCLSFKHTIYLQLSGTLTSGSSYTITFPPGASINAYTFTFQEKSTRCRAIHVDQSGHRPNDVGKLAYLSEWVPGKGTDGEVSFAGIANWYIINAAGTVVFTSSGAPVQRATPTSVEGHSFDAPQHVEQVPYEVFQPKPMKISGITKATTARVTVDDASSLSNGDRVVCVGMTHYTAGAASNGGMSEVDAPGGNQLFHTVGNKSGNSFDLVGVNSTGFSDFTQSTSGNKGNLCFRVNMNGNRSQTYVYGLDYSTATLSPGTYYIWLPGIGVSDPIIIDDRIWNTVASVYAKGCYHQRMGCVQDGRFGYTRPLNFRNTSTYKVYKSYVPYAMSGYSLAGTTNGIHDAGYPVGAGGGYEPWITSVEDPAYGGHSDAGDWDVRFPETHGGWSQILTTFEFLNSTSRLAINYGIPTCLEIGLDPTIFAGTNGLPSPIVEVIWGIEQVRQSQQGSGAVSAGMNYGEGIPGYETSWNTSMSVYTWYPDHITSIQYVFVAAKLARILATMGYTALSNTYKASAIAAYDWAVLVHTDATTRDAHYLPVKTRAQWTTAQYNATIASLASQFPTWYPNAAAALFYLTGLTTYKTVCDSLFPPGASAPANLYGSFEYANAPGANSTIRDACIALIKDRALSAWCLYQEAPDVTYANGQYPGFWSMGFGGANNFIDNMPSLTIGAIAFARDGDMTNARRCRRAMQYAMQHRHGANQMGICMTKGIGVRNLLETLHIDSRYNNQTFPIGLCSEGWANNYPFLPVFFGQSFINRIAEPQADPEMATIDPTLPFRENYPYHQRCFPRWEMLMERYDAIEHMEFTTQQQLIPAYAAALYLDGYDSMETATASYQSSRPRIRIR